MTVRASISADNFVPSFTPEPLSIMVPVYRSALLSTGDDDFVPSAVPEPSSITMQLFRLPAASALETGQVCT